MIENTCRIGSDVLIGYTSENNAREFRFDIGKWKKAWPEAKAEMLVVRPDDDIARPVLTRIDGSQIVWTVRRYDTEKSGRGRMWVVFNGEDGEMLGETPMTMVRVVAGPPNVNGEEPPETELPWVGKVINAAQQAENAQKRAEEAAEQAEQGKKDGGYYSPSVSDEGDLSWSGSREDMPPVPGANIRGPRGYTGDAGPVGPTGPQGIPGHTPEKGIDYFTDAEKAQIVSDVIAALPVYAGEVADA